MFTRTQKLMLFVAAIVAVVGVGFFGYIILRSNRQVNIKLKTGEINYAAYEAKYGNLKFTGSYDGQGNYAQGYYNDTGKYFLIQGVTAADIADSTRFLQKIEGQDATPYIDVVDINIRKVRFLISRDAFVEGILDKEGNFTITKSVGKTKITDIK